MMILTVPSWMDDNYSKRDSDVDMGMEDVVDTPDGVEVAGNVDME